jgi:hypothetical protein
MGKHYKKVNKQTKKMTYHLIFILSLSLIVSLLLLTNRQSNVFAQRSNVGADRYDRQTEAVGNAKSEEIKKSILEEIYKLAGSPRPTRTPTNPDGGISGLPNNWQVYVPNGPSNTDEAKFADQVVASVQQNCISANGTKGVVYNGNYNCIDKVTLLNNPAKTELKTSAAAYQFLQCVACPRGMAKATNKPYNGWGNAKTNIGQLVSGYKYYENTPSNQGFLTPGSIGVSNFGTYGHLLYITEIYKEEGTGRPISYKALECNYGASGSMRHNIIRLVNSSYLSGWQKPI